MYLAANETHHDTESSWLDTELTDACRCGGFETGDMSAVVDVLRQLPIGHIPPRERQEFANAWLFAAHILGSEGLPRSLTTMVSVVAAGDGFTARHARRVIALFVQRPANDGPA